jgi:glyoxylase I family protein
MSKFPAIGHLALTVSDLDASTIWYNRVFDTEPAFAMSFDDFDRQVYALPGGQVLGLTRHKNGNPGRFDPTVIGLDHVGLTCGDLAELEAWAARLTELGVDNSGARETAYGTLVSFSDPDGNAFDFIVPPRALSADRRARRLRPGRRLAWLLNKAGGRGACTTPSCCPGWSRRASSPPRTR